MQRVEINETNCDLWVCWAFHRTTKGAVHLSTDRSALEVIERQGFAASCSSNGEPDSAGFERLSEQVRGQWGNHLCTNASQFDMHLGDVWAGSHEKTRVMSLEQLKTVLKRIAPEEEVEFAFRVETIVLHGVGWDFATNITTEYGLGAGLLGITACGTGKTTFDCCTYLAVPKARHIFAYPDRAEKMYKWAVQHCRHNGKPVFKRGWFLVTEATTASHIALLLSREVEVHEVCCGGLFSWMWRSFSSQRSAVPTEEESGPKLYVLIREQEGTCALKVKNNRRIVPSRDFKHPGFF